MIVENEHYCDMKKVIIIDYALGEVDIYPIECGDKPVTWELLGILEHHSYNCDWMVFDGNITFHKEVIKVEDETD